ncbi:MAG: cyclic 2,3-diphosphoglycerate synthase [Vicinamibacteria bacterium]|nr:cyclic 2,3-diphosphoglycerate synthase [Vicinamibacteria bacterium]
MAHENRVRRIVIVGAAGRDFHNFNVAFRDDWSARVVAFTATQIPGISGRQYPPELAGPLYPKGIPIFDESELEEICRREHVTDVVFSYSDIDHATVMHVGSRALAAGANFVLLGPQATQIKTRKPVIAVSAARTGCGKSQTSRFVSRRLRDAGLKVAVLRHPMPYGDLLAERVQRFATMADLDAARCTAEEREEYEPHLEIGNLVFAGVDYAAIVAAAERECDVLIWDGGNNDFPFLVPDLHVAIADALRPDHVDTHHPGEAVLRMADVIVVNKVDSAADADVQRLADAVRALNPKAHIVRAASPVSLDKPELVAGKRAIVVEDGPTLTHGGMSYGAGYVAAVQAGAAHIVDPRSYAAPEIAAVYAKYPHIGRILPCVGYDDAQLAALGETLRRAECDVVVSASPIDLAARVDAGKPIVRARYDYADAGEPALGQFVGAFIAERVRETANR